jgi:hypothetical protein
MKKLDFSAKKWYNTNSRTLNTYKYSWTGIITQEEYTSINLAYTNDYFASYCWWEINIPLRRPTITKGSNHGNIQKQKTREEVQKAFSLFYFQENILIKRTFEKDDVLAFGPYSDDMVSALERIKLTDLNAYYAALYIAHDSMQAQLYNMKKHPNFDKNELHQLKKVGFTFSAALQREVYGRKHSEIYSQILDNAFITTKFVGFQNTAAKFKSNFYFYNNTELKNWVIIKDNLEIIAANKIIKKINERKMKKDLQSINLNGFDFSLTIQLLLDSAYEEERQLGLALKDNPEKAIKFKTARTNNLKWNNIANLRKEIRETLRHEDGDIIEVDMVAAYPSIMPIFLMTELKKKSKTHSSMLNQYNHYNKDVFQINQDELYQELDNFIELTKSDIYQQFLVKSGLKVGRNVMKQAFLHFLFDNQKAEYQRDSIFRSVVNIFKTKFSNIYKTILCIKHDIGHKNFSINIQNITSKLMKETIKRFQKVDATISFLPICDCFYVPANKKDIVIKALTDVLKENNLAHVNLKEKVIDGSVVPPSQLAPLVLENEKEDPTNFHLLTSLHGFSCGGTA